MQKAKEEKQRKYFIVHFSFMTIWEKRAILLSVSRGKGELGLSEGTSLFFVFPAKQDLQAHNSMCVYLLVGQISCLLLSLDYNMLIFKLFTRYTRF